MQDRSFWGPRGRGHLTQGTLPPGLPNALSLLLPGKSQGTGCFMRKFDENVCEVLVALSGGPEAFL